MARIAEAVAIDWVSGENQYLHNKVTELEIELSNSKAEVARLKAGVQTALDTPSARAWILEHTLLDGGSGCCSKTASA